MRIDLSKWPDEYSRPWKLITFAMGLGGLLWGASTLNYPDWDIGVSVLMAVLCYIHAPRTIIVLINGNWQVTQLSSALFWMWFTVDGSYTIYHVTMGNVLLREGNFPLSLWMYVACGIVWAYPDDLPTGLFRRLFKR